MSHNANAPTQPRIPAQPASNPDFPKQFEELIRSWADATAAGKTADANPAAMQALIMAAEEAVRNPTPSLLLKQEADDLEAKGDWCSAEIVRRKILVAEQASCVFGLMSKVEMDLCRLLRAVGRIEEARRFARSAIDSARRANLFPVLVTALDCAAFGALEQGDLPTAQTAISEALQIIEPGKIHDPMRARVLIMRARYWVAQGDAAAALDLAASRELILTRADHGLRPGRNHALANWWEVKSDLEMRQGNLESAKEAILRAIETLRHSDGPFAHLVLARALDKLGAASKLMGDLPTGEQAVSEAKSIRENLHLPLAD
jgi:tetratricopeptide (TPR) repeat protein